jgi:hypothetical protein
MLKVPRPQTRAECVNGPRPCPWVACSHHTLLEVTQQGWVSVKRLGQRKPRALRPSADDQAVTVWTDDVLEELAGNPHSCVLDVADRGALLPLKDVAGVLRITRQAATLPLRRALAKLRGKPEAIELIKALVRRLVGG